MKSMPRIMATKRRLVRLGTYDLELALRLAMDTPHRRRHYFGGGVLSYPRVWNFLIWKFTIVSTFYGPTKDKLEAAA